MLGAICAAVGVASMFISQQIDVSPRMSGVVMLLTMATFWLLIPFIDWVWYKLKFPKAFNGTNIWKGKWSSSVNSGAYGRIDAIFPSDYKNTGAFNADALLYSSIRAPNNPGMFRRVTIAGEIAKSVAGNAMVASASNIESLEVSYNALISDDANKIAGGYKDVSDVGTFWIQKEPF